ncbi:MAG TPA: polysaccharide deacetylase family protein [Anaerolineales bacterium]|nr:polysaccharide deacetylase family protein [Anaerolineales bacterium]
MKLNITVLLIMLFFSGACRSSPVQAALIPGTETLSPVPLTLTPTFTATALPTATLAPTGTPILGATPEPIRKTPPTLMLHRPNLQFDSLAFLKDFINILKQNNMKVVTYRDIYEHPEITATEQGKLFIITIDDISLAYPMDRHVIEMIGLLREAGYPAVLGVVTATDYPDRGNVARLRELSDLGWEIASHTDTHANLGKLEKASSKLVYNEVYPSLDKIEKTIGIRPITLVLPEGQMVNDINILCEMKLFWVVGINGGVTYDSRNKVIYVGREGPDKNAEYTYKIMKMRFGF